MTWGVTGLTVSFGSTTAVGGVDLTVDRGEVVADVAGRFVDA